MKNEPGYKIDPVSAATRSHFVAWILAISSLFASSKPTQTKVQHFTDVFDRHITDTDTTLISYALHDHAVIDCDCQKSLLVICR
jgi:hypothetical protein